MSDARRICVTAVPRHPPSSHASDPIGATAASATGRDRGVIALTVRLRGSIRDIELKRDALQSEVASLETGASTTADKAKDNINGRVDQLKDRIRQITRSL